MTPPDALSIRTAAPLQARSWGPTCARTAAAFLALFAATFPEWRAMAHQWWDIDTYAHILLIPPIIAWLIWLRRDELSSTRPVAWWPGLVVVAGGLVICLAGRAVGVNGVAQVGAVLALQGAALSVVGLAAGLLLAFPLFFMLFLVPFGDEIVAPLQAVTARIALALAHLSGVPASLNGLFIDTPAGRFVVAEECSGVKFLIAMVALGTLVAWTAFVRWRRRVAFVLGAAVVSVLANGVRAWGTIYAAQFVGIERAGGIDHIIYGWVFFALVVSLVLSTAWRYFEREPHEAGLSAVRAQIIARRLSVRPAGDGAVLAAVVSLAMGFAVLAGLL